MTEGRGMGTGAPPAATTGVFIPVFRRARIGNDGGETGFPAGCMGAGARLRCEDGRDHMTEDISTI